MTTALKIDHTGMLGAIELPTDSTTTEMLYELGATSLFSVYVMSGVNLWLDYDAERDGKAKNETLSRLLRNFGWLTDAYGEGIFLGVTENDDDCDLDESDCKAIVVSHGSLPRLALTH